MLLHTILFDSSLKNQTDIVDGILSNDKNKSSQTGKILSFDKMQKVHFLNIK